MKKITELLNHALAQAIDLKLQAKQAHWNVKGENFISLHELFDKLAQELDGYADLLAERVLQLEETALGTLQAVSKTSSLKAYPVDIQEGKKHLTALKSAMQSFAKHIHEVTVIAAAKDDEVTADICTEIGRDLSKMIWFVSSHLDLCTGQKTSLASI